MLKNKSFKVLKRGIAAFLIISSLSTTWITNITQVKAVEKEESYTQYVDPFVCTEVDYGQLFPGSVVPNGLVKLSPDTYPHNTLDHAGYDYKKLQIQGFSHTRIEGVGGQGAGGDVLVTPTYVQYTTRPNQVTRAMKYTKDVESAKPGYYSVELTPNTGKDDDVKSDTEMGRIKAELTTDQRTGYHRYTFPKAGNINILADLNYTYHGTDIRNAILDVVEESEITTALGGRFSGKNVGGSGKYTMYFYMETSKPANNVKTWNGNKLSSKQSQKGNDIGAILNFNVEDEEVLELKVSISPISVEQAKIDMHNEIKDWKFDAAYKRADKQWNDVLSKIKVENSQESDPTGELKKLFYTHLYHMFMTPVNATSTSGTFRGTDGKVHEASDYTHYDSWTLWDDYRKYPMIGLLLPDVYKDMVRSIANALDYGIVTWSHDKQPVPNVRTEHAVALLADGVAKGFTDIDNLERAYEEAKKISNKVVKDDIEYIPHRVDQTVEYAYDDWALSLIAKALGKDDEAEYFLNRSFNYKNLFKDDADKLGDKDIGLLMPKDSSGNWVSNVDPKKMNGGSEYQLYQGSIWQYTWYDSNDVNGLMDLMGGKTNMYDALSMLFGEQDPDNGKAMMHNAANEVELHAPYLFNFAGRPDRTQYWVRQIYTGETWNTGYASGAVKEKMYKLSPKGYLETMDDDAGTMAMMFVSAAMGIFPMTPGDSTFQIGTPFFEKVTLDVGNGKVFVIEANNVSEDNFYIQSATLNGASFDRTWIDYSEITRGGVISFEMGDQPSTWAQNGVPAKSSSDSANTAVYDDKDEIAYSTTMIEESKLNDGSIDEKIEITLKSKEFIGEANEDLTATGKIKVTNVPEGLTANAIKTDSNKVEVSLNGKAKKHTLNDSIGNLKVEITDSATNEGIEDSIRKVKENIKVIFSDNKLTYSSTELKESANDDGSITDITTITLSGDARFTGEVNEEFVESGKVILTNVPEGLTAKVIKTGDKTVVLSFEGKAKEHAYDVEFGISFTNDAFDGALASQVENSACGGMTSLLLDLHYNQTTKLKQTIQKAKLIKEGIYTSTSYAKLQDAIEKGEEVLAQEKTEDSKISKAIEEITDSMNSLRTSIDGLANLEAEDRDDWSGGSLFTEANFVHGSYDGAWLKYDSLDFSDVDVTAITVRYDNNSSRCAPDSHLEIRKDSVDGELIGTVELPATGSGWGTFKTIKADLDKPELLTGIHDIYFVMRGTANVNPYIAKLDYMQFNDVNSEELSKTIRLEGEASHDWSGNGLKNESINIGGTYNGAWIKYNRVDFADFDLNAITVRYDNNGSRCAPDSRLELRLDSLDGETIGTVQMPQTGTSWGNYGTSQLTFDEVITGVHDIYFVMHGITDSTRPYIANIDYMEFNKVLVTNHIEAENRNGWSGGELKTETSTDNTGKQLVNIGGSRNGSWLRYNGVKFDGSDLTEMTVRYSHNPSSSGINSRIDVYLDNMEGNPVGTIKLPTTNGWANYTEVSATFEKAISETHDVYLVLRTDGYNKWVANIDWLEFNKFKETVEVDKAELQKLYDANKVKLKQSSLYETVGFTHFKNAMNYAEDVLENIEASENDVRIAIKNIKNTLPTLQLRIIFDLSDMVVAMEEIKADGYTSDSYAKLQEAIKVAKEIPDGSEYEVYKAAYDELYEAHSILIVLNKEILVCTIERAEAIDLDRYIEAGKEEFIKALEYAKELLAAKSLTQKEVDDAVKALDDAINELVVKGMKSDLEKKVNGAEAIRVDEYTDESVDNLNSVLAEAKKVLANENSSQEDVDNAIKALEAAVNALVKKDIFVDQEEPEKPSSTDSSVNPQKPNDSVETSDNTSIGFYTCISIFALAVTVAMRKRKEYKYKMDKS